MQVNSDFHSHVSRSSADAMARAAQERGLRTLGLSEHLFQLHETRAPVEHMVLEGPLLSLPVYVASVRSAAQSIPFDVRLGLEVDFIPEKNERIQESLRGIDWDFLIGSVHEVDGDVFELKKERSCEQGEQLWLRYMQLLCNAVNSGYFHIVSHPVRMRMRNPHLPRTLDRELEHLAAEATRCNVALELNGYDILTYPDVVMRLAKACVLHQTPVSIGSDAHMPAQIARAYPQTEAILREVGITKIRIWKSRMAEDYNI